MRAALVSEYRKLVSTRMWWILLLIMAVYMAFLAGTFGFSFHFGNQQAADAGGTQIPADVVATSIYSLAVSLGYVFPVIVGALSVTGEFRHQTITPTLLAEPRRTVVVGAKLLAAVPVGLVFGVVGTLATAGTGAAVLSFMGHGTLLGEWEVQRGLLLSVLALAVWTAVGVGIGAMLPNQVAAIVALLAFTQFVEPMVRIIAPFLDWADGLVRYLPGAAGDAMAGSSLYIAFGDGGVTLLDWWQGLLVLLAYGLVFAAIGRVTTFRKDIT